MGRRGPRSTADLNIVSIGEPFRYRSPPPRNLTPAQAEEWRVIVESMPAGFFTAERLPLLENLARHIVLSDLVSEELKQFNAESLGDSAKLAKFRRLARLHLKQSKAVALLSTKLRLTPQARYEASAAAVRR